MVAAMVMVLGILVVIVQALVHHQVLVTVVGVVVEKPIYQNYLSCSGNNASNTMTITRIILLPSIHITSTREKTTIASTTRTITTTTTATKKTTTTTTTSTTLVQEVAVVVIISKMSVAIVAGNSGSGTHQKGNRSRSNPTGTGPSWSLRWSLSS